MAKRYFGFLADKCELLSKNYVAVQLCYEVVIECIACI